MTGRAAVRHDAVMARTVRPRFRDRGEPLLVPASRPVADPSDVGPRERRHRDAVTRALTRLRATLPA